MKRILTRAGLKPVFFLLVVFLLAGVSCSRRAYRTPSHGETARPGRGRDIVVSPEREVRIIVETGDRVGELPPEEPGEAVVHAEPYFYNVSDMSTSRELGDFLKGGTGRILNEHNVQPAAILETARSWIGVPHCMGGRSRRCIDCSGLLMMVFGEHGIYLPHISEEQARYGRILGKDEELRAGDLVFFIRSYRTRRFITHAGIYAGNNQFIHTSSRAGVIFTSMDDPWWRQRFVFATRVF